MNDQEENKLLNELLTATLEGITRLRSNTDCTRAEVMEVLGQAESCITQLAVGRYEAQGVAGMMSEETEHFAKMNKKLAGMLGSIHSGGKFGTG